MNARKADMALRIRLNAALGTTMTDADARILRRAEIRLRNWGTRECNGDVQRDEETGDVSDRYGRKVRDHETATLKRVAALCAHWGLSFYHQGDPRGAALYVAREPMTDSNYASRGVSCWQ